MSLPDSLTVARAASVPFVILLYAWDFAGHNYWATAVFAAAMATDWFDGRIARSRGHSSPLGSLLDPAADKIDWQFETGQTGTHMVLPSRDARTIFTSNIGSDSVSMIEAGAGGQWTVADLGSTNGVQVNGRRITGATPLKSGDHVVFGTVDAVFEVE